MAEEKSNSGGPSLPPKLDLRKTGVLKGHVWPAPGSEASQNAEDPAEAETAQAVPAAAPASAAPKPATPVAAPSGLGPKPAAPAPSGGPVRFAAKPVASPGSTLPRPVAGASTPSGAGPKPAVAAPSPVAAKPVGLKPAGAMPGPSGTGLKPAVPAAKPVASGESKPTTARIQVPSAESKKDEAAETAGAAAAKPVAKRQTSRIPLEMAAPVSGAASSGGPKTIKIKPAVRPASAMGMNAPQGAAPASSSASAGDAKRQTSRIPLESALAADLAAKDDAGAPKTIRLKRPGEQATIKATPPGAAVKPADAGSLGKTSRLDEAVADSDGATPTRRKTIRVKRPTQVQGVKSISIARPEGEEEAQTASGSGRLQPPVRMEEETETVGWFIGVCGIAATIVACLVIYVLLAQVVGPNGSLTPLSYGAPGLDLSWTGEVKTN